MWKGPPKYLGLSFSWLGRIYLGVLESFDSWDLFSSWLGRRIEGESDGSGVLVPYFSVFDKTDLAVRKKGEES